MVIIGLKWNACLNQLAFIVILTKTSQTFMFLMDFLMIKKARSKTQTLLKEFVDIVVNLVLNQLLLNQREYFWIFLNILSSLNHLRKMAMEFQFLLDMKMVYLLNINHLIVENLTDVLMLLKNISTKDFSMLLIY